MYVITEWFQRYEVNDKGRAAREGDSLRATKLDYIRSKVHGREFGAGFSAMAELAKSRTYEVFGLFHKFLEIAASEPHERRGSLLNAKAQPATLDDLAFILRTTPGKIAFAMQVLTDKRVGWIFETDTSGDSRTVPDVSGDSRTFPGNPGAFINETKRNENEIEFKTTTHARTHAHAREDTEPQEPPADETPDSTLRADSSSTSTRPSARQAAATQIDALNFDKQLRELLGPRSTSDVKALWNLEHWALARGNGMCERICQIAVDCRQARKPIAAFFARLDHDVGYRARAEADKRR